mmetsp:Transcript_22550/g.32283  ORF Transcript_22550/g.32283 Transcript_22550/m.32283 type:complete len:575 (+) Transcript_22550:32-1756(+)
MASSGIFSLLLLVSLAVAIEGMTPLIDSTGSFHRSGVASLPAEGGIIALINPSSTFSFLTGEDELQGVFLSEVDTGCTLVLSPGANTIPMAHTIGTGSGSNPVRSGYGCAAASVAAGVIVLDGFETSDLLLENGETSEEWKNSRLGRSLSSIFAAQAAAARSEKVVLILCVKGDVTSLKQQAAVMRTAEDLYKEVMETKRILSTENLEAEEEREMSDPISFDDLYDVMLVQVESENDAKKVMDIAYRSAAEQAPITASTSALISDTYSCSSKTSSLLHNVLTSPRSVTSALLLCNDCYLRYSRSLRAKMVPWKNRVARNLLIDKFGSQATTLYNSILQNYDYETCSVSGGAAAGYRLAQRSKLEYALTRDIGELFRLQLAICESDAIKQLQRKLLKLRKADALSKATPPKEGKDVEERMAQSYDDNAAAVRATSFAFDTKAAELEVPPLQLTKTQASRDVAAKLYDTLNNFDKSAIAQLQDMKLIQKTASRQAQIKKKQRGTEPSIDIGLNLVAMFRPDGFGNFQGFAGYNLGPYGVTVGVQNDADSLEVLNQFGGLRPPFLRFQPKLNFDIEL